MKFGICNETFGDWPLDKAAAFARECGYTGWEVAPFMLSDDIVAYTADQRRQYRQQIEAAGLTVIGLHWLLAKTTGLHLTTPDSETRSRTSKYLSELARLCRDLGGELMVLGSPQQRNYPDSQSPESAMENAAEVLRATVPALEDQGVKIAVEPLGRGEGNFLNTAAEARQLISLVASEHVQLHLDVKAMSDEPSDVPTIIRDNADALIHFHANDPNLRGPGMGDVDFVPILDALKEVHYGGWVSVEVFDYEPGAERLARESIENMVRAGKSGE